jgi:polysaccharide biosynthesis/export protein
MIMIRRLAALLLPLLLAIAGGEALAQGTPSAPAVPAPAQPQSGMATPAPGTTSSEYVIGPGDTLQVFVWNHPELTITVPVRPDGQLSVPLVENVGAAGKAPSQLAREIETKLSEYVRSPTVNVIVTNALSTFSQVKVIGQVAKPMAIPYRDGMTVLDAVLAVGGLGEFAAGNRSRLLRTTDGKQQEIKVRLKDIVEKGRMKDNVPLKPGDVLVVPQSAF